MDFYRPIPNVTASQSLSIRQIDLNDYYRNDPTRQIIRCQICKLDISRKDVFKHTVSKRHKYNKLFVAVSQNCCRNGDEDFIVLDIDRLSCRYCDFRLKINSDSDDAIISHIKDIIHYIRKKQTRFQLSTAAYSNQLLQPLDSFVTHDVKNRKQMNKKVQKIQKEASSLVKVEQMSKELKVMNNVGQETDQQYSLISRDYQKKWGKELPKCITINKGNTYMCNICCTEIPTGINNLGIHINGRRHTKNAEKSEQPETFDVDKFLNDFKIGETITNFKGTKNIIENNIPQSSAVCKYEIAQSEQEFKDCIRFGEDSSSTCTVCDTEIPNTSKNINEHLNGKKHKEKIAKLIESEKQKLKLKDVKKVIPAPIGIVKETRYRCTICHTWVANNANCIKQHNEGKNHLKLMLQTKLTELAVRVS